MGIYFFRRAVTGKSQPIPDMYQSLLYVIKRTFLYKHHYAKNLIVCGTGQCHSVNRRAVAEGEGHTRSTIVGAAMSRLHPAFTRHVLSLAQQPPPPLFNLCGVMYQERRSWLIRGGKDKWTKKYEKEKVEV